MIIALHSFLLLAVKFALLPSLLIPVLCQFPTFLLKEISEQFFSICVYSSEGSNKLSNATVSPKIVDNLKNLPELFSITFNNQLALSLFYCFIETIEEPYKRNLYCLWVKHIALVYIVWVGKKNTQHALILRTLALSCWKGLAVNICNETISPRHLNTVGHSIDVSTM